MRSEGHLSKKCGIAAREQSQAYQGQLLVSKGPVRSALLSKKVRSIGKRTGEDIS